MTEPTGERWQVSLWPPVTADLAFEAVQVRKAEDRDPIHISPPKLRRQGTAALSSLIDRVMAPAARLAELSVILIRSAFLPGESRA